MCIHIIYLHVYLYMYVQVYTHMLYWLHEIGNNSYICMCTRSHNFLMGSHRYVCGFSPGENYLVYVYTGLVQREAAL